MRVKTLDGLECLVELACDRASAALSRTRNIDDLELQIQGLEDRVRVLENKLARLENKVPV